MTRLFQTDPLAPLYVEATGGTGEEDIDAARHEEMEGPGREAAEPDPPVDAPKENEEGTES
jgi:hypothetical protein